MIGVVVISVGFKGKEQMMQWMIQMARRMNPEGEKDETK